MQSIIFIAPPAAGKGTQSDMLSSKYNIPHISTGRLLREETTSGGKYSDYIKQQMHLGNLVKDEIILEILKKRINEPDCNRGYILDGFPRDIEQARAYEKILKDINKKIGIVILLDLDKDTAMKRMIGRRSCSKCGLIYNDMFEKTKSKEKGFCDQCHSSLIQRDDDNEETFNQRYETYIKETSPLIEYYESKGILRRINSSVDKNRTFDQIEKVLKKEGILNDIY